MVLPTGAGKSAVYQVPALLLDGPTVVVSPLIALQRDQIAGLARSAAPPAVAVNSAQPADANERAWDAVTAGTAEYLFLSPEQLANDEVLAALVEAAPSLFVVDEAHCVAGWGHDFRPDYLRLRQVIDRLGHPPVVALTATAGPAVRAEIVEWLGLDRPAEIVGGFDRPNLELTVSRFQQDTDKRRGVVERVLDECGPGLVYVATRKDTTAYADELAQHGVNAHPYHAGLRADDRRRVQQRFMDDEIDVVVATSAFGMGIDKPNLRFVVHASIPASLEAYYQEIGRAGRDGRPARATLCYRPEDLALRRFLTSARPRRDDIDAVARRLRRRGAAAPSWLRDAVDLSPQRRTRAVNLLERAGAVTTTTDGNLRYIHDGPHRTAVDRAVEIAEAHQRLIRSQIEMIRGYADTTACRREYLLGYFGEARPGTCGACDTCHQGAAQHGQPAPAPVADAELPLNARVRHPELGDGVVSQLAEDRVTVLFENSGYRVLDRELVRDNNLLTVVTVAPADAGRSGDSAPAHRPPRGDRADRAPEG